MTLIGARRVARRFFADKLTKKWLMSVRRGWIHLLDKLNPDRGTEFSLPLEKFLNNLDERLRFTHQGVYTHLEDFSQAEAYKRAQQSVRDQVTKTIETNDKLWGDYKFYRDRLNDAKKRIEQQTGQPDLTEDEWRGVVTDEQYERAMVRKYPELEEYFEGSNFAYVVYHRWLDEWKKPLVKSFDVMMRHLYLDAAERKKLEDMGQDLDEPERYTEYAIDKMKVVIDDTTVTPRQADMYAKYLTEAWKRLQKRGFGKVWYGTVFVKCKDCGGENPYGKDLGTGGNYSSGPNTINIFVRPSKYVVELMAHELGHRWWYKHMSRANRQRFEDWIAGGLAPVSAYGGKKDIEAFAEVFAYYVIEKPMTSEQATTFKLVSQGKFSVTARQDLGSQIAL